MCNTEQGFIVGSGQYIGLCRKCRRKEYYKDHKEQEVELCKKWYYNHRQSEIEKNTEYRKQKRELFDWYHNKDRFDGVREIILKRDNYKCQICGDNNLKKLAIHHIDGNNFEKEFTNNVTDNLITLCWSHHQVVHWYQRKNNMVFKNRKHLLVTFANSVRR